MMMPPGHCDKANRHSRAVAVDDPETTKRLTTLIKATLDQFPDRAASLERIAGKRITAADRAELGRLESAALDVCRKTGDAAWRRVAKALHRQQNQFSHKPAPDFESK